MGLYVINIGAASAKQWIKLSYETTLNGMSNCQLVLDGVTGAYVSEFDVDKDISVYKGGTLKFKGIVTGQGSMVGGGLILYCSGIEIELSDEKAPMVGAATTRVWTATSDHTILNTIITSVSGWTLDVSNSSSENIDFRTSATESVWNSAINMISQTGKDIWVDQANKVVYLYDEYTRDDQFSFIEGKNASDITRNKSRSKAGKVIIYGKGDGVNQIIGSHGSGTPVFSYIDRNIVTTTEANKRALTEYNKINPQLKTYSLVPTGTVDNLKVGDMGNIANNSANINEEVDIVRLKTVVNLQGIEKLNLEVTNPAYRIATKNVAEERAKSDASFIQSQTSMQGSTNVWGDTQVGNGDATTPLVLQFYVPPNIIDDAGVTRMNSVELTYKSKDYVSYTGALTGSTGNAVTNAGITNASAVTGAGITNASSTTGAGITNAIKGSPDNGYALPAAAISYSNTGITTFGSWVSMGTSVNTGSNTFSFHWISGFVRVYSTRTYEGFSVYIRAKNTTDTSYSPNSYGIILGGAYSGDVRDDSGTTTQQLLAVVPFFMIIPSNWTSKNYVLEVQVSGGTAGSREYDVLYRYGGVYGHTHSNSFNDASHTNNNSFNDASHTNVNSFNDANHANPAGTLNADYSLGTGALASTDTNIKIYNSANSLLWESGARGETSETDIDVSAYLTANDYYRIEIYPNNDAYMFGTVHVKGAIES